MTKAYRKNTMLDLSQSDLPIIEMSVPDAWHDLAHQKGRVARLL